METELLRRAKRLLAERYSDEYRFHFTKPINAILAKTRSHSHVLFADAQILEQQKHRLRRFYTFAESVVRMANYAKYYAKTADYLSFKSSPLHAQDEILLKRKRRLAKCAEREGGAPPGEEAGGPRAEFRLLRRLFAPTVYLQNAHQSDSLLVLEGPREVECQPRTQRPWEDESCSVHDVYARAGSGSPRACTPSAFHLSISSRLSEFDGLMASAIAPADSQSSSAERELAKLKSDLGGSESLQVCEQICANAKRPPPGYHNVVSHNSLSCANTRESCSAPERMKTAAAVRPVVESLPLGPKALRLSTRPVERVRTEAKETAPRKEAVKFALKIQGLHTQKALNKPSVVRHFPTLPACKTDRTLSSRPFLLGPRNSRLVISRTQNACPPLALPKPEKTRQLGAILRRNKLEGFPKPVTAATQQRNLPAAPFGLKKAGSKAGVEKIGFLRPEPRNFPPASDAGKNAEKSFAVARLSTGLRDYAPYTPVAKGLSSAVERPKGKGQFSKKLNLKFF